MLPMRATLLYYYNNTIGDHTIEYSTSSKSLELFDVFSLGVAG